jgi:hypothetical protein
MRQYVLAATMTTAPGRTHRRASKSFCVLALETPAKAEALKYFDRLAGRLEAEGERGA